MAENRIVQLRMGEELRRKCEIRAGQYSMTLSEYLRSLALADVQEAERRGLLPALGQGEGQGQEDKG